MDTNVEEEKPGQQNTFQVAISFILGCPKCCILNIGITLKFIKLNHNTNKKYYFHYRSAM